MSRRDECFYIGDAQTPEEILQNHWKRENKMTLAEEEFVKDEVGNLELKQMATIMTLATLTNRTPQDVESVYCRHQDEINKFIAEGGLEK